MKNHLFARCLAAIAGPALGVLLGALGSYPMLAKNDNGYGLMVVGMIALIVGVPLLVLNIGLTVYLKHKSAAGKVPLLWMWLPVLAGGAVFPVYMGLQGVKSQAFESAYPLIEEIHVNLSGSDLWSDPATGQHIKMPGDEPMAFHSHSHWPSTDLKSDTREAYAGPLLAASFKSMKLFREHAASGPASVKRVAVSPVPSAWAPFASQLGSKGLAEKAIYLYYYYPDRVDVTRAIRWGATGERKTPNGEAIVDFFVHNLGKRPIARLEINGQPITWDRALDVLVEPNCSVYPDQATARDDGMVWLRWQFAEVNPAWHEARVALPKFKQSAAPNASTGPEMVHVFLWDEGKAAVQRVQELAFDSDRAAIRLSDPALVSAARPACGTAAGRYSSDVKRVID